MKKFSMYLLMVFIIVTAYPLNSKGTQLDESLSNEIFSEVLVPFFSALQNGDITELKNHLSSDEYNKNKRLLELNESYPDFLRQYYQGAEFDISSIRRSGDKIIVTTDILLPDGSEIGVHFSLIENVTFADVIPNQTKWKIDNLDGR